MSAWGLKGCARHLWQLALLPATPPSMSALTWMLIWALVVVVSMVSSDPSNVPIPRSIALLCLVSRWTQQHVCTVNAVPFGVTTDTLWQTTMPVWLIAKLRAYSFSIPYRSRYHYSLTNTHQWIHVKYLFSHPVSFIRTVIYLFWRYPDTLLEERSVVPDDVG